MVTFNELRICDGGKKLIIDCEIEDSALYDGIYINNIYLEHYKNASVAGMPGEKAVLIDENKYGDTRVKSRRIVLESSDIRLAKLDINSFAGELFYVIVQCDGNLNLDAIDGKIPCGADDTTAIGAVLDWHLFYSRGMSYIASMFDRCGNPCQPTDAFEHFILLWNALKLAIETCDWETVKDLWQMFKLDRGTKSSAVSITGTGGCGCGR